jgi:hypothetical protein
MATRKRTRSTKRAAKTRATTRRPARKAAAKKTRTKVVARKPAKAAAKRPVSKTPRAKSVAKTAAAKPKLATKRATPKASAAPRVESARRASASIDTTLFPCGEEALRTATGKGWNEWLALLDNAGAAAQGFDHQRLLDLTMQSLPESAGWWGQMVSVGYERVRGLREKHESCNGEFQATLSKTFSVPLFAAFAAWADAGIRGEWLDAPDLSFTKLNAGRNIRARWPDGSLLDIRFNATGPDRCQIVVDTMKLNDGEAVQKAKAFWQAQFERLQHYFRV